MASLKQQGKRFLDYGILLWRAEEGESIYLEGIEISEAKAGEKAERSKEEVWRERKSQEESKLNEGKRSEAKKQIITKRVKRKERDGTRDSRGINRSTEQKKTIRNQNKLGQNEGVLRARKGRKREPVESG